MWFLWHLPQSSVSVVQVFRPQGGQNQESHQITPIFTIWSRPSGASPTGFVPGYPVPRVLGLEPQQDLTVQPQVDSIS